MLKWLAILTVLLAVTRTSAIGQASAASGRTHTTSKTQLDADRTVGIKADDSEHRVKLTGLPPITLTYKPKTAREYLFDWGPWVFSLLLVIIGAVGLCAAYKTLKAIESQANHMVASERAWITIRPVNAGQKLKEGPPPDFWWEVKNVGKTPARLIETQSTCRATEDGSAISEVPAYYGGPVRLNKRILAPGDCMKFFTRWTDKHGDPVRRNLHSFDVLFLAAYGTVKYQTMFSDESCVSGFCDGFEFVSKDVATPEADKIIEFRPNLYAAPEYTKHT
jgi:hypothetical protein